MKRRKHVKKLRAAVFRERAEGARKLHLHQVAAGAAVQEAREELKRSQQSAWELHERYTQLAATLEQERAVAKIVVAERERYFNEWKESLDDASFDTEEFEARLTTLVDSVARQESRLTSLLDALGRLTGKFDTFVKALNEPPPQPQGSTNASPSRITPGPPGRRTRGDGGRDRGSAGVSRLGNRPRQSKQDAGGAQRAGRRRRGRPRKSDR